MESTKIFLKLIVGAGVLAVLAFGAVYGYVTFIEPALASEEGQRPVDAGGGEIVYLNTSANDNAPIGGLPDDSVMVTRPDGKVGLDVSLPRRGNERIQTGPQDTHWTDVQGSATIHEEGASERKFKFDIKPNR